MPKTPKISEPTLLLRAPDDDENADAERILFGIFDLQEAKRLKSALESQQVSLELFSNPETCSSGSCGTSVEIHLRRADAHKMNAFLLKEKANLLHGHNVQSGFDTEIFDTEKETATCPACGTVFSTLTSECPDCGLGFSVND